MKLRKFFFIGFVIFLIFLDFAALDDITTSGEGDYFLEYLTLVFSFLIFSFLAVKKFSSR